MAIIVSVVIPTFNRVKILEKCLESLCHQDYQEETYEIIVVNDGSTDETHDRVQSLRTSYKNLYYIRQDNAGHAVARNVGFSKARGQIIVSLDDDCIPCANWIQMIIDEFRLNPQMSICCGKIINLTKTKCAWAQYLIDYSLWVGNKRKKNIKIVPTANTAYRKAMLSEGALQNDGKYFGYRDIMFNNTIMRRGYRASYCPDIKVIHLRWDHIPNARALFINGQIRHGNGFRVDGYKVYGLLGSVIIKLPKLCYILIKTILIGFRSFNAKILSKYLWAFRWIIMGLSYQASAIKGEHNKNNDEE